MDEMIVGLIVFGTVMLVYGVMVACALYVSDHQESPNYEDQEKRR